MPFKFPLPGPLKRKLLPGEGLDGDRFRAGLGSGLGFRAGVSGWGSGAGFRAGVSGLVWISGLVSQGEIAVWGRPGFSEKKCGWDEQKYLSSGMVNLEPSIAPQPDAGERVWSDCA